MTAFFSFSPLTKRRLSKFKKNRRGYYSLLIFLILFVLSLLAEVIANDRPLLVRYKGRFFFPVLVSYAEKDFGGTLPIQADFRDPFIKNKIEKDGYIVMPPIPFSYSTINFDLETPAPSPPSTANLLGTDDQGRDVLARMIYGFRLSVFFGVILTFFSSVIGISAGAVQGYVGGKTDLFCQRLIEIWSGMPQFFVLIVVSSLIVPSFFSLLFVLLLFSWTALVGLVRAEVLRVRNFEYVKAAYALGVSHTRIILRHVLPNAFTAALTYLPFILCGAIASLTALDFLGFGLPITSPSLGDLVRQGKDNLQAPWLGISIFCLLAGILSLLVFVGEALRDAFDPRKEGQG